MGSRKAGGEAPPGDRRRDWGAPRPGGVDEEHLIA